MICKAYREKIVDLLAGAGAAETPRELGTHLAVCQACQEFYQSQSELFRSMDTGMKAFVNQPVPQSLLYSVPAPLLKETSGPHLWISSRNLGVIGVVSAVLLVFSVFPNHPRKFAPPWPAVSRPLQSAGGATVQQTQTENLHASVVPGTKRANVKVVDSKGPDGSMKVIVLPEEREDFVKFVAELPAEGNVALALTRPAARVAEDCVEITLLEVGAMELKPLERTPSE